MKIQTKTTLLFTSLTLAVFLVLAITVYYFSNKFAYNDFYKRLELRARVAAKFNFENDHTTIEGFKEIQREYLEKLADEKSYIIRLSDNYKALPPYPKALSASYFNKIIAANGSTIYYRDNLVHYAGLLYRDETGNFLVIESATNAYGADLIRRLGYILVITIVASVIIIYTVGLYFSKRTFRPFRSITKHANEISEVNLQLRLEETDGKDEVAELVVTFNKMLDRLETAFDSQTNFVNNASHELRTPLTAIVAEADYALSKQRSAEDYRNSLQQIMQQADKLQQITKGLLSLAKTGFDGSKQNWELISADELLYDAKKITEEIFPECVITLKLPENVSPESLLINGNRDLLNIAIGNIFINACKYSNNSPVNAAITLQDNLIVIAITDKGIGIPENEIRDIKVPFFRASNTTEIEGHGVGLPLSNNIIKLHKGNIAVHSKVNEGTEVLIILPVGTQA